LKINKIIIVGGGSSGWISAAFLIKTFPKMNISVIESPDYPIIGVGESTILDIIKLRDFLELNEKEFMKLTDASYKLSIKFTDFYKKDYGSFHYPFRTPDLSNTEYGLGDWLELKALYPEINNEDFVDSYFPSAQLFKKNKFCENPNKKFGNWNPKTDAVYHFDSVKFGIYLKEKYCIPRGVKLIQDSVEKIECDNLGIKNLILKSKKNISGDLYLDCTGFKSLLLGETLKEEFISYSHILPNNRAWAAQVPYINKEIELEAFTNCTAIENGWCWNIPLWSRLGAGYVYSDKFVDPEEAKEEFKNYLMSKKMVIPRTKQEIDELKFKDIKMKIGIHKRTFVKNVVAIGLSAGFIEPLESNGLYTVHAFIGKLAKTLLRGEINQFDRDIYNTATKGLFDNFAEFVAMHYALSLRNDTKYWQDISNKVFDQSMVDLEPTSKVGFFDLQNRKMFSHIPENNFGITYISVGMNYPFYDRVDQSYYKNKKDLKEYLDNVKNIFNNKKIEWNKNSKECLSLYQYLLENIHLDN
jgi:flavin-dependent dehydrogenase